MRHPIEAATAATTNTGPTATAAVDARDPGPDTVPGLEVLGPDGRAWSVRPARRGDTVGDLARALGLTAGEVAIEGRSLAADVPLVSVPELRVGARVDGGGRASRRAARASGAPRHPAGGSADADTGPVAAVAVRAGPAASSWRGLAPGRHVIGRSHDAAVRIADPALEPYHGVLDVADDGTVTFRQLTGVHVARVDGRPCDGAVSLDPGDRLEIGSSIVQVRPVTTGRERSGRPAPQPAAVPGDPWRLMLRRAHADQVPPWRADTLDIPPPPGEHPLPPPTTLVGAAVGVVGALVLALVLGHAGFALFALVGASASGATWAVGAGGARRRRRSDRRRHERAVAELCRQLGALGVRRADWHGRRHPTIVEALGAGAGRGPGGPAIWARRTGGPATGSLRATVGLGDHPWPVPVPAAAPADLLQPIERCRWLTGVAAPISIRHGAVDAVVGPRAAARAVTRSVIVQLATWYGPADWGLVVVTTDPAEWDWARWLPHVLRVAGRPAILAPDREDLLGAAVEQAAGARLLLLVTDDADALVHGTGAMRRAVAGSAAAVLACLDEATPPPACCRRVLEVGVTLRARWSGSFGAGADRLASELAPPEASAAAAGDGIAGVTDDGAFDGRTVSIRAAGLDRSAALDAARRLAPLVDPEAVSVDAELPAALGLFDLLGGAPTAGEIAARWRAGGVDVAPATPIGRARGRTVTIDLARDGPHALVAGTTGSGKSELLRTLVAGLALHSSPEQVTFVLVDYKGGSTFDGCARFPHTVGLVTDLDEGAAARALTSLEAELRRRERLLRRVGVGDLPDYRRARPGEPLPRLVVVVDEFAALARELPGFIDALVDLAQRGRSLGIHLVLATQRPAGVVNDDIRTNTAIRVALRLPDPADAHDVVGESTPVALPRDTPGRAVLRLGPDRPTTFQSARCTAPAARPGRLVALPVDLHDLADVNDLADLGGRAGPVAPGAAAAGAARGSELDHVVAALAGAMERCGYAAAHRPWRAPLPAVLGRDDVTAAVPGADDAIGLIDDPAAQAVHPLAWDPTAGTLALVGAVGSGLTSSLISLVASWCRRWDPDALHVYVVDGHGDDRLDALAGIAHCGAVVRLHESERLHRLLARMARSVAGDHRQPEPPRRTVLVVDGVGPLRSALGEARWPASEAQLDRVLREGGPAGVTVALADHGAGASSARWPIAERWLFHVDDPALGASLGVRLPAVPGRVPGRLRVLSSGLEAQVALGAEGLAALPPRCRGDGPPTVDALPATVSPARLAAAGTVEPAPPGVSRLPVGLGADDLRPVCVDVPDGEHVVVTGAARTGVTTTLARVAAAWEERYGPGSVVRWCPGAGVVSDTGGSGLLVVVDDAHRVEDAALAALAAGRAAGPTLAVGVRSDAVRAAYGHWTRDVTRSRCGIVMSSPGGADGELLGAALAARTLVPARPGLGWVVDGHGPRLAQIVDGSAR